MSREIKFRGMDLEGRWFYGNLAILHKDLKSTGNKAGHYISNSAGAPFAYAIRPETVGQYTGLKDKNEKEIFDGDIIACKFHPEFYERINWSDVDVIGAVFWDFSGFSINAMNGEGDRRYPEIVHMNCSESEIIGNIYENPVLLKLNADR